MFVSHEEVRIVHVCGRRREEYSAQGVLQRMETFPLDVPTAIPDVGHKGHDGGEPCRQPHREPCREP